jgi:nucleoside-diphosphate-sugar epimerase
MRVAVVGATGNIGTAVLGALSTDPAVDEIVGIARREPSVDVEKVRWETADIVTDDLVPLLQGADAVVHLAWLIQPSHDVSVQWNVNAVGSARVFDAAAAAGVRAIVYSSSVGAYSPGPKDRPVDESWPTHGVPNLPYSNQKAYTERLLDAFEARNPDVRVVRIRPGLVLQAAAASEVHRLFLGPLLPNVLMRRQLLPVVPRLPGLRFQVVHGPDAGQAFRLGVVNGDARGAYNIAADPILDADELGRILGARPVRLPAWPVRLAADLTWRAHLQPTDPAWVDALLSLPVMDTTRARTELGWEPRTSAGDALVEILDGMARGTGHGTPPLHPDEGVGDVAEGVATGIGVRDRRRE